MTADDGGLFGSLRAKFVKPVTAALKRPARILLVDDEPSILYFAERALGQAGYQVSVAGSGAEALQIAEAADPFDLLLTDVVMPPINGDELARQMRRLTPGIKVLYLTGYSDNIFADRTMLWEDEAFVEKPCSVEALLQAVSLLLSGHTGS